LLNNITAVTIQQIKVNNPKHLLFTNPLMWSLALEAVVNPSSGFLGEEGRVGEEEKKVLVSYQVLFPNHSPLKNPDNGKAKLSGTFLMINSRFFHFSLTLTQLTD